MLKNIAARPIRENCATWRGAHTWRGVDTWRGGRVATCHLYRVDVIQRDAEDDREKRENRRSVHLRGRVVSARAE